MDGKAQIEKLVNTWYGFGLFTGFTTILMNGIGILSILGAIISTCIGFAITFALGRLLMRRSGVTRWLLVALSALSVVLGIVGIGGALWTFFTEWSFSLLVYAAFGVIGIYVNAKSFNVLTDKSVKAYFAR